MSNKRKADAAAGLAASFFADAKPAVLPVQVELEARGEDDEEQGEVLITPLGAGQEVGRSCIIVEYA
jgi:hypothetical protein